MAAGTTRKTKAPSTARLREVARLEAVTRHGLLTMTATAFLVSLGLGGSVFLLIGISGIELWPWPHASLVLPAALALAVGMIGAFLVQSSLRQSAARMSLFQKQYHAQARAQENYDRLMELSMACRTLPSKNDLDGLCTRITQIAYDAFGCDRASLLILDQERKELEVRAALGRGDMDLVLGARQEVGDAIAGWVAEHRRPLLLGPQINVKKFWRFKPKLQPILSSMAVPLLFRDELFGVLCVCYESEEGIFTQEDLRGFQVLAFNGAVSIRNLISGDAEASQEPRGKKSRRRRKTA